MTGTRWGWRYLAGLVVAAGLAALLAGGVKATLVPGEQSWWRTTIAEGVAGATTAMVTLLFFDRLREKQAARARRLHDVPLIAAVAAAAHELIAAWPENDGIPPEADPTEAARKPPEPTIPDLSALAELSLRERDALLATAQKLQVLRRAAIDVLDAVELDNVSNNTQTANLLDDGLIQLDLAKFLINHRWKLASSRRESRVTSGQMLLDSVLVHASNPRPTRRLGSGRRAGAVDTEPEGQEPVGANTRERPHVRLGVA